MSISILNRIADGRTDLVFDCSSAGLSAKATDADGGTEEAIQLLLDVGARRDVKDAHGDSPLGWASWHLRPISVLRASKASKASKARHRFATKPDGNISFFAFNTTARIRSFEASLRLGVAASAEHRYFQIYDNAA